MESVAPNFISHVLMSVVPTVLFILLCVVDIYSNVSIKEKIKGIGKSFLCSYFCLCFVQHFIFWTIELAYGEKLGSQIMLAIEYIIYLAVAILFSYFMTLNIESYNRIPGVTRKEPFFGVFIYAQYLLMIYVGLIFADSIIEYSIFTFIIAIIWYLFFRKKMNIMSVIYPNDVLSISNICLFFEVIVVIMLWFLPETIIVSTETENSYYILWIEILALFLFAFCICLHSVIFNSILHQSNEVGFLTTDTLTGLATRAFFLKEGEKLINNAPENKCAVVFLNINNFKYYNQNFGEETGDKILIDIADILKGVFGEKAIISRLSDDHFAIATAEYRYLCASLDDLEIKIKNEIKEYPIKVRVGVFLTGTGFDKITDALDCALRASQDAAKEDNVSIQYYDSKVIEKEKRNSYISENLDRVIEENLLTVYYQPIFDVEDRTLSCAEALVRWIDDKYGFLPPDQFVPFLEINNLIYKVDCFVLEQICKDQRTLLDKGKKVVPVSFNISRKDFYKMDMVEYTNKIIEKYNIPKELIKIEITESALVENEKNMGEQIKKFRSCGYKVWMDDFGAGYSSLNAIGTYPFDGIKLDLVFLRNLTPEKIEIMRGVVSVANQLGVEVLCEGVETEEHFKLLKKIGCQKAQGYLFSKPIPLNESMKNVDELNLWTLKGC